jgi:hypothetical protein
MPTTTDRVATDERAAPQVQPPPQAPPRPKPPTRRRVTRWIQWMAGITILALTVGAGMWLASREPGTTIQEQAADWPDCWPMCSAVAELQSTPPAVASQGVPAQAVVPDCWPLCSYTAAAVGTTATLASATTYPNCWPLCAETARIAATQPPTCWPLCSHITAAATP